jgi:hydroxymethylbilane synthase
MPCLDNEMKTSRLSLVVGARSSPLSRAQVQEVLKALQSYHPSVDFDIHYVETVGDRDQMISLRQLERTDFFTREIDQGVLEGKYRLGVHSAKDLPLPLPQGLSVLCLTKGLDASDALVLRPNEAFDHLPSGARIATSSARREEAVKTLRADLCFYDLRGTIEQRLAKLNTREVDGVIVAEAALIRLRLTHVNRIKLPGPTAEGQGQLAVVGRENDEEMRELFACLDIRK